jgi:uncharacterized membrane protein YhaH (DUF805 family)
VLLLLAVLLTVSCCTDVAVAAALCGVISVLMVVATCVLRLPDGSLEIWCHVDAVPAVVLLAVLFVFVSDLPVAVVWDRGSR